MRRFFGVMIVVMLLLVPAVGARAAAATCAGPSAGGDWPSYGHDLSNTRNQPDEHTINTSNVANLKPKWMFSASIEGATGPYQSTPVVAAGCVYVTTGSGYVFALNADTGEMVWHNRYAATVAGVCCGSTLFAPAYHDGVLYVDVSSEPQTSADKSGPYALALDAATGDILWKSASLADEPGAYTNASAVYFDGMLFVGISGAEGGRTNAGGFAILDASNGAVLKRTHTISDAAFAAGYGGGSIWATAAVDTQTMYAYAGTGQPSTEPKEDPYTNAILKIDVARARDVSGNPIDTPVVTNANFGEIVDAYKATPDDTLNGVYVNWNAQAPCAQLAEGCLADDLDVAASPTLYRDALGREMVAELQKSGVMHAVYAATMESAWQDRISPISSLAGNYSSSATDGTNIYDVGDYPGQMFSLGGANGGYNWVSPDVPTAWSLDANPVTYANGVVYNANGFGFLNAYDASDGVPLFVHQMSADTPSPCTNAGGGVAIARNTVYAICGAQAGTGSTELGPSDAPTGWVIAYGL